jgi:3-methyl-2-oxobutanoate hydroxymethyltransferase
MSAQSDPNAATVPIRRLTVGDITKLYADGQRIPMLTAYDYPTANLIDQAGVPLILVGDSLGRVYLGYENEIPVSMADMLHHTAAVTRGARRAFVVGDMPFLSYATPDVAVANAGRFLAEAGAQAVKVEGGVRTARTIEAVVRAGIPVMGHIGWTPQAANAAGKVRVLGKTRDQARSLLADALAVQEAGAFGIVLELVPDQLARAITERLRIPTIGIGAGPGCSGQVQVITDLLGMDSWRPKHARAYADLRGTILKAASEYVKDVEAGTMPAAAETVRMDDEVLAEVLGRSAMDSAASGVPVEGIPLDRDL